MEEKKNKKLGVTTIKGAIIEIIISALVFCGTIILFYIASQSAHGVEVDLARLLIICIFASVIFLLDGIITIPYVIKQKKSQKNNGNSELKEKWLSI